MVCEVHSPLQFLNIPIAEGIEGGTSATPHHDRSRMTSRPKADKTPLQRMTDLTRRIVAVPKSEIPTKRKKRTRKRH